MIILIYFFVGNNICVGQKTNNLEETTNSPLFKNAEQIINAYLEKKSGIYAINHLDIVVGKFQYLSIYEYWKNKTYNGRISSFHNSVLGYFGIDHNMSPTYCEDDFDNPIGGCYDLPAGDILVQLPYFPNGKYADIYDPSGKKVLTIDLSSKAACNENDQCDRPVEDGENCPQDCKKNEPKIDPAVVQLAANNQAAAEEADTKISLTDLGWWGIAILVVLLAGGGIGYWVYRKKQQFD